MDRGTRLGIVALFCASVFQSGCSTTQEPKVVQPSSPYSALATTSLVYSDPMASAPVNDHPLRWLVFAFHPVGVFLDYAVNRPIYNWASQHPNITGFTAEDATLHAQRPQNDTR
jgi:hypothetical protein